MAIQFTLVAEGGSVDEKKTENALSTVSDLEFERVGPERGAVDVAVKVVRWILDFTGDFTTISDALVKLMQSQPPGASFKIKMNDREFEITNLKQDKVLETLNVVKGMLAETGDL